MKKYFTIIALLLMVQQLSAINFYDQLCAFNPNWKKYPGSIALQEARVFNSDKEYVQAHLGSVLYILRSNPVENLTEEQYQSRKNLIELLDGYRKAGNFPINYYRHERIPVFIDQNNTHCAVGYLLQQTGHELLALRIAAADNYIWVKDIKEAAMLQWQQASGLSLEELKLIQGAYEFYTPNAFELPNKYEIPQKPACITAFFEKQINGRSSTKKTGYIWCHGEGDDTLLNGRWEQNYAIGIPWIVGYFDNGKRTGQWMEYYQGTAILCRTENWKDDKLNGIRKRFDREGKLIEEILFKDGNAVTKTNYDLEQSLTWVRTPIDSSLVWTEVFNMNGNLIAKGHETIYNPGNLLWFQNIELTALNSAAITSREIVLSNITNNENPFQLKRSFGRSPLYNATPLVEYKKEGDWIYYRDCMMNTITTTSSNAVRNYFCRNYQHFGEIIFQSIQQFSDLKIVAGYDSIKAAYANDMLQDYYGYGISDFTHLYIRYYPVQANRLQYLLQRRMPSPQPVIKEIGQYNSEHWKTGTWKYYNKNRVLYKTENYILPQKEDYEMDAISSLHQAGPILKREESGTDRLLLR